MIANILWLLIILYTLIPVVRQYRLRQARTRLFKKIERRRDSRLISLIHRQETLGFLGIAFARFINIEDSEQVLRAIRLTPDDRPIDLILHTPGGLVLAAEQIAHAIAAHSARVTVFVPHYAMSGGTLIALAANEIYMDPNAVLGPVDPQIGRWAAPSILSVIRQKGPDRADDETLMMADVARKATRQVRTTVFAIMRRHTNDDKARDVAEALTEGRWTHDYPLMVDELEALGVRVERGLPGDVYRLMQLYPQPSPRRPSVQYIPEPHPPSQRGQTPR